MPNSLLAADTLFPKIDEEKSQNENLRTVTNYLYMLVEELRYTFSNLGADNFNETELQEIANIITEPVYIQLADDEGNISALLVQVNSLSSRLQYAEGNISVLTQTSTAIQSRLTSAEGDISTLTQTAQSIEGRVSTIEGDYASLSLTVGGLSTRVSSAEGNITTLTQTAQGLQTSITGVEGDVSALTYTIDGLTVVDSSGTTLLNGSMLKTGTVIADNIRGEKINIYGANGFTVYGEIYAGDNTAGTTALEIKGIYGMRVISGDYQNIFIQAGGSGGPFISLSPNTSQYANNEFILFDGAPLRLGSASYGSSLPSSGQSGQIFFLKA